MHIDRYGAVTVFTGKVEVGQNARTSLTQAVAEELGAPLSAIEIVMGDTERTPFDMGTFGSMTTPQMVPILRRAASAARELLPATEWQKIDFAQIAKNPTLVKVVRQNGPSQADRGVASHGDAGAENPRAGNRHRPAQFTPDMKVPGMLYGRVLRPETFNATLVSFDGSAAQRMPGR